MQLPGLRPPTTAKAQQTERAVGDAQNSGAVDTQAQPGAGKRPAMPWIVVRSVTGYTQETITPPGPHGCPYWHSRGYDHHSGTGTVLTHYLNTQAIREATASVAPRLTGVSFPRRRWPLRVSGLRRRGPG